MFPDSATNQMRDKLLGNSKLLGQLRLTYFLRGVQGSYFFDLLLGQFRSAVLNAYCITAFLMAVGVVLASRTMEQMRTSTALAIIALVEHVHSLGNRADLKFVRYLMNVARATTNAGVDFAVAVFRKGSSPDPAGAKFGLVGGDRAVLIEHGPEACGKRGRYGILGMHYDLLRRGAMLQGASTPLGLSYV